MLYSTDPTYDSVVKPISHQKMGAGHKTMVCAILNALNNFLCNFTIYYRETNNIA